MIIHLRIPKTASTSFYMLLTEHFQTTDIYHWNDREQINAYNKLSIEEKVGLKDCPPIDTEKYSKAKLVTGGHFSFGLHFLFQDRAQYVTMLRDPVERIVSNYYYFKRLGDEYRRNAGNNILEHVERHPRDLQTFLIAGERGPNMLQNAKKNIAKHFSFVGITEMFSDSIALFNLTHNLPTIPILPYNVTKKSKKGKIDEEVKERIRERNQLDIELYTWQVGLLKEKVKALSQRITVEKNKFESQCDSLRQLLNQILSAHNEFDDEGVSPAIMESGKLGFFGASGGFLKEFERIKTYIQPRAQITLFDSDVNKQGKQLLGIPIRSPKEMCEFRPEIMVVTSCKFKEIIAFISRYQKETDCRFTVLLAKHLIDMGALIR